MAGLDTQAAGEAVIGAILNRQKVLALAARALLWLGPCLAVWYLAASAIAWLPANVARIVLGLCVGDTQVTLGAHGAVKFALLVGDGWRVMPAAVELEANASIYTMGLPLFAALVLATRQGAPARVALASAVLLVTPAIGLTFDVLRQLAGEGSLGPLLAWGGATREGIALGYQAGSLLLPTLLPVAAWLAVYPALWSSAETVSE